MRIIVFLLLLRLRQAGWNVSSESFIKDKGMNDKTLSRLIELTKKTVIRKRIELFELDKKMELLYSNNYNTITNAFFSLLDTIQKRGRDDIDWQSRWFYITSTGRLAYISKTGKDRYKYQRYINLKMIDPETRKANCEIPGGLIVKHRRVLEKLFNHYPWRNCLDSKRQRLESLFDPAKLCRMVIDTDFNSAYKPDYYNNQQTEDDLATGKSCMSCNGEQAQLFYGGIPGCKVCRFIDDKKEGDKNVGRCIVYDNGSERHFIRIYGFYEYHRSMIDLIREEMRPQDVFGRGERIDINVKTSWDDDVKCLYIDSGYGIYRDSNGDYWFRSKNYSIDSDGETTDLETVENLCDDGDYMYCAYCDERVREEDATIACGNVYCCEECAENDGYHQCEYCYEWIYEEDVIVVEDGKVFCCDKCAERYGYEKCDICDVWRYETLHRTEHTHEWLCQECAEDRGYVLDPETDEYIKPEQNNDNNTDNNNETKE